MHGAAVRVVERPTGPLASAGEADALVTATPNLILAVRVADCVPLLVWTAQAERPGIAAIHAGWRGAAAGVVPAALEQLLELTSAEPDQLAAAIGPTISGPRYEVGDEVVEALQATGAPQERFVVPGQSTKPHVDVGAVVRWQLAQAGVRAIGRDPRCTFSDAQGLHSYRRDGAQSGRQAGLICLTP